MICKICNIQITENNSLNRNAFDWFFYCDNCRSTEKFAKIQEEESKKVNDYESKRQKEYNMNIAKDSKQSFEDFQKNPPKKGAFGKIMLIVKTFNFLWNISKNIFIVYLMYKTIFG